MKVFRFTRLAAAALLLASCSKRSGSGRAEESGKERAEAHEVVRAKGEASAEKETEKREGPEPEEIGEDCVAFLRSTKAVPPGHENKDCLQCEATEASVEVLKFNDFEIDRVAASETKCEVAVRLHAQFNPSVGGKIVGGLTGWISPEHRAQYARGETPAGEQIYDLKVVYARTPAGGWKALEFDRRERD
ncbi:MAG: hypothetical protein ACR2NX_15225 [Chthoniobacterales bacterium]